VDDRIHSTDRVDLIRDTPGLSGAAEIADYDSCGSRGELADGRDAIRRSGVQDHSVSVIEKRLRRRPPESVRAARNKNNRHSLLLSMSRSFQDRRPHARST
jgi:hypothetical protein